MNRLNGKIICEDMEYLCVIYDKEIMIQYSEIKDSTFYHRFAKESFLFKSNSIHTFYYYVFIDNSIYFGTEECY